jgi:hypothetical protein
MFPNGTTQRCFGLSGKLEITANLKETSLTIKINFKIKVISICLEPLTLCTYKINTRLTKDNI